MKKLSLFVIIIALFALMVGCAEDPQPSVKNRVPAMPQQSGVQLQVQIQQQPSSPAELKEGRPEHTNLGVIVDVFDLHQTTINSDGYFMGFTFQEEGGFVKRFYPVCSGQTIPANKPVALLYHWRTYDANQGSHEQIGCYQIDGLQTK